MVLFEIGEVIIRRNQDQRQWGEGENKLENDFILRENFEMNLFGEFEVCNTTIWIVTSSKRNHTNILFPIEF